MRELETFVLQNQKDLYSFCLHLTGDTSDAEDLFQDTFLVSIETGHYRELFQMESAKGYLIGIAANLWKNRYRKRKRRERIAPQERKEEAVMMIKSPEAEPEEQVILQENAREVRAAVDALPEPYRITILMYYEGNLSIKEIAQALHIRQGTVKSRLSKARQRLRGMLIPDEEGLRGEAL